MIEYLIGTSVKGKKKAPFGLYVCPANISTVQEKKLLSWNMTQS